jgi:hypothetical protein
MKKTLVLFALVLSFVGTWVEAKPAPESGASGDARRALEAGLREMGRVSVPPSDLGPYNQTGSYDGVYNVQCFYSVVAVRYCEASKTMNGPRTLRNDKQGALLLGSVLKSNIDGTERATIIRSKLVACNSVGDECAISGNEID